MTDEKTPPPIEAPSMTLSKDETVLLWQLINNSTAGVPFKVAEVAGELYNTIREYARAHGIATNG